MWFDWLMLVLVWSGLVCAHPVEKNCSESIPRRSATGHHPVYAAEVCQGKRVMRLESMRRLQIVTENRGARSQQLE